jgi:hypothetical protein
LCLGSDERFVAWASSCRTNRVGDEEAMRAGIGARWLCREGDPGFGTTRVIAPATKQWRWRWPGTVWLAVGDSLA